MGGKLGTGGAGSLLLSADKVECKAASSSTLAAPARYLPVVGVCHVRRGAEDGEGVSVHVNEAGAREQAQQQRHPRRVHGRLDEQRLAAAAAQRHLHWQRSAALLAGSARAGPLGAILPKQWRAPLAFLKNHSMLLRQLAKSASLAPSNV